MTKPRRPRDPNQLAKLMVDLATGAAMEPEPKKGTIAAERGRKGGLKGGAARAGALSARRRKQIAKKAAAARWGKGS